MPGTSATPADILAFWRDAGPDRWYRRDDAFDAEVRRRFLDLWRQAAAGELSSWQANDDGALALVIVLDQFPRNMFRAQARTYAADALARDIARRALARGFDRDVSSADRQFFYLPFMHSEDLADQEHCVALARDYGNDEFTEYAEQHADIVRRFGRFPHRNAMLGRATTPAEQEFLDGGGFAG
jgi:uncharacterized protein (DUF924 family)